MLYDKDKEIIEKYKGVLGAIGRSNKLPNAGEKSEIDLGTAYLMLKEMASKGDHSIYAGVPSDFNWDAFKEDVGL